MKLSQVLAVVATLIVSLFGISWLANSNLLKRRAPEPTVQRVTISATADDPSTPNEEAEDRLTGEETAKTEDSKEVPDFYNNNPYPPASGPSLPKAVVPEARHGFDRMVLGATGEHDFVIRNEGTAPLKLAKGPTQCKCTLSGLKDQEIPPGGEGTIHLKWTPKDVGDFEQNAVIWTNDPQNPRVELIVGGQMFEEIIIQPHDGWQLGTVHAQRPAQLYGRIASNIINNLEITKVETSSDRVQVIAIPLDMAALAAEGEQTYLSGYQIAGTVDAGDGQKIDETVTFHTNQEKYPTIQLKVQGVKAGPALLMAPFWYSAERLLNLGLVSSEKGKSYRITMMVEPGPEPLQFTEISTNPSFLKVSLKPETVGGTAAKERYTILVDVPPGSPRGSWIRPTFGKINIKTNRETMAELELNVDLLVE